MITRRSRGGLPWENRAEWRIVKALVVIDMLNDFVTGSLKNPRAEKIIPTIQQLVAGARADRTDWLVVYANDAHLPQDFELRVWGEHAMAGTPGADVIPELTPAEGDFVLPKRTYSSFHETGLDDLCRQFGVDALVLTGQHTNICLRHTMADAFFRGYDVVVPKDAVEAISEEDHESGLKYLEVMYKVDQPYAKELLDR
jgi:nicotinamidase-related amidase